MRILSIDYGKKRLGIAISDELGIIAQPLTTITRDNTELEAIAEIVRKYNVKEIVIGLPINWDGSKGKSAIEVEQFTNELKTSVNVKIQFVDERLSTTEINKRLIEFDLSRKKRRRAVDKLSAAIILERYLEKLKNETTRFHEINIR